MKTRKWLFTILILGTMLSLLVSACAPAPTPQVIEKEVIKEVVVTPTPLPPKKFEGRSINFLAIQPHTVASKAVAKWFEEETGARVNVLIVPYGNVTEKAVLDVTSGAGEYDAMEYWYPMLGSLVENGVLVDVTDWWNQNADELQTDDFLPSILEIYTVIGGKRYGVPYDGDLHLLFYNTTIFEKYNLKPPETWDDYLEAAKTITEGEAGNEIYGCGIMGAKVPIILIGTYLNRLGGYGGSFFDEAGNPSINSPEAVAALEALVAQSAYALPEPAAVAFDEMLGGWLTGRVAMAEFWTDLGQMSDNPEQSTIIGEWAAVPMPKGSGPKAKHVAPLNAGFGLGVSTMAQDPELAMEFLKFCARPDINVRANTIVGGLDPTRASTFDAPEFRAHVTDALADASKEAHAHAVAWPTDAKWAELQEVLNENLSLALIADKTPQEALDDTQAAWEDILK
ncbi:MAG: sugar ABC transporter substrate-binding protein [Chloroflexota bacterium]|nr:sugar ABC transporter substrate-binding protein [Anaerolineae bacterium]